jgi:sulfur carrier protein
VSEDAIRQVPLTVNGEPVSVTERCTVGQLLEELGFGHRRIAVAVNRNVVPRSAFAARELVAGDRIEILEAVGGG